VKRLKIFEFFADPLRKWSRPGEAWTRRDKGAKAQRHKERKTENKKGIRASGNQEAGNQEIRRTGEEWGVLVKDGGNIQYRILNVKL
jgi:hypothetical protein